MSFPLRPYSLSAPAVPRSVSFFAVPMIVPANADVANTAATARAPTTTTRAGRGTSRAGSPEMVILTAASSPLRAVRMHRESA